MLITYITHPLSILAHTSLIISAICKSKYEFASKSQYVPTCHDLLLFHLPFPVLVLFGCILYGSEPISPICPLTVRLILRLPMRLGPRRNVWDYTTSLEITPQRLRSFLTGERALPL